MNNPKRNVRMRRSAAVLFIASLLSAFPALSEEMPHITGESLSDKPVDFPSACAGSVCIIVIGFSHSSKSQVTAWADRTNAEFHNNPNVAIYSIAVLEDAPRFVRGMAVHGMKSGTPVGQRDHFAVVYKGELDLKRLTGFQKSEGADAYILFA